MKIRLFHKIESGDQIRFLNGRLADGQDQKTGDWQQIRLTGDWIREDQRKQIRKQMRLEQIRKTGDWTDQSKRLKEIKNYQQSLTKNCVCVGL